MTGNLMIALGSTTVLITLVALLLRRAHLGAVAFALAGLGIAALFFLLGFPGLGLATLACSWGVASAAPVVTQVVSRAELTAGKEPAHEPRLVALFATITLVTALALGVAAVDWPVPERITVGGLGISDPEWGAWVLVLLGVAAALSLASLAPRNEDR